MLCITRHLRKVSASFKLCPSVLLKDAKHANLALKINFIGETNLGINVGYHKVPQVSGQNQCYKHRFTLPSVCFLTNFQTQVLRQTKQTNQLVCS